MTLYICAVIVLKEMKYKCINHMYFNAYLFSDNLFYNTFQNIEIFVRFCHLFNNLLVADLNLIILFGYRELLIYYTTSLPLVVSRLRPDRSEICK